MRKDPFKNFSSLSVIAPDVISFEQGRTVGGEIINYYRREVAAA
jgi:hypothetical protein